MGGEQEGREAIAIDLQGTCELARRGRVDARSKTTLNVAHGAFTDACPLGQFSLAKADAMAQRSDLGAKETWLMCHVRYRAPIVAFSGRNAGGRWELGGLTWWAWSDRCGMLEAINHAPTGR